ncbi:MAG: hypothetical protein ACTSVU_02030 [Promethearchaeota archaeon]
MAEELRECPYCGKKLKNPYWRHIEKEHHDEYMNDKTTWIQLFKDYTMLGMNKEMSIQVISDLFNRDPSIIKLFLKKHKII